MYISRASGNDSWSCDQEKPCKTIWRAVTLASRGDHIYLDGTNTEKDPYTCQSGTLPHTGIYISKSVSLIGFGPMPPHIRCSKGNNLTFDGSDNAQQIVITLSGLLLNDSFVYFQDSSVNIDSCKFKGSKRGIKFLIRTRMVSSIQITNSTFVGNKECISVIANSTKNLSHKIIQLTFKLNNSSFYGNAMSDKASCMSFTEAHDNDQSVSCNITLENVTFSHNKFSLKGLVFLELENGNQSISLHKVTLMKNNQVSVEDVYVGYSHSEFFIHSNLVNIFVNAINFTSQIARAFNISASNVTLQIYNSSFGDHKVKGNGGVVSVKGIDLCVLKVSDSSFINTRAAQGGVLNVKCAKVRMNCEGNVFRNNTVYVFGGVLYVKIEDERWRSKPSQITVKSSTFLNNRAYNGGAIYLEANNKSTLILENVTIESNSAEVCGGALWVSHIFALKVRQSRLLKNSAQDFGGAFDIIDVDELEVTDSLFEENYARGYLGGGGAFYIDCFVMTTSIVIINTTFSNCSCTLDGGAVFLSHEGNVSLVIKRSHFVENFSLQNFGYGAGGAISTHLSQDIETNPGCIDQMNGYNEQSPSWAYKSQLYFKDTTFERNAGNAGGALYLSNGKATFRNCYFVDNFAFSQGGHIYTLEGPASLIIQDSVFQQTMKKLQLLTMNYSKASFIHAESSGAFKVYNKTMDVVAYGTANPLLLVSDGRMIDLGNDNFTEFICPVGSEMEIIHFTEKLTTQVNNKPCKIKITTLEFSCSPCEGNSYSLQRGRALGSQLDAGFQCLPCPFGANCSQNILAKRNFWGFQEQNNPPTLRFTMCPVGYCSPPRETNFSEYNGCQGNRSDELCGHCSEGYTETLYSTHCRPSHQCNDYWFWSVALAYVSLLALYFIYKPPIMPWIKRQILWFKGNKPDDLENNFDKGFLKILFYFYQASNLLLVSSYSQYPIIKSNLIEPIVGLFNFQLHSSRLICPFSGLTVVTKQLFSVSHVFGTLLMNDLRLLYPTLGNSKVSRSRSSICFSLCWRYLADLVARIHNPSHYKL